MLTERDSRRDRRHRVEIRTIEEATARGERVSCGCGGRLSKPAAKVFETFQLGDEPVQAARFRCDRCQRERALYFRLTRA